MIQITVVKVNKPNIAQKGTITVEKTEKTGEVFSGVNVSGSEDSDGRALAGARLEYKNRFANEKCAIVIKDKSEEVRRKNAMEDEKSKITAVAIEKMIDFYQGNLRDIEHFLKVWAYAKTIGEQESVDENTQGILELAAVVHDISCPLCREKYGNTNGKNQELESEPLVKEFFEGMPVSEQKVERIIWLVTHHHTYTNIDGIDYQILIEADFLVNASESNFSKVSIENAKSRIFKTAAGCRLLESIFLREE